MRTYLIILITFFLSVQISTFAQSLPIGLDGLFDDWTMASDTFNDTQGDGAAIDLLSFSVSNDSAYLYIKFTVANEMQLNSSNDLFLEIDTDNDASTGYSVNGIGAELGWKLGGRYGYFNYGTSSLYIHHDDIEFYAIPTVTSNQFEMAVSRNAYPDNLNPLFTGDTIKICFVDQTTNGDLMPNVGQTYTYIFDDTPVPAYTPIDLAKTDSWHLRLLSYNTLFNGLIDTQRQPAFERVITAVAPDIITFNECWDTQWYEAKNLLNSWLPLSGGASWSCWKIDGANITCSRYPILQNWKILPDRRLTASLIDLPVEYQHDIVVINAHFKCCDGDSIRQREADAFINFVRDIKTPGGLIDVPAGTPFVLSGDLNLVGYSQQLTTLITGDIVDTAQFGNPISPDWDNSDLADIIAMQTDRRMAFTWQDNLSSYWPGRLDFAIASEGDFVSEKAYTMNTAVMTPARLTQYGLQQNDTETASDHLPKLTDFSMPIILDKPDIPEKTGQIRVYPNPSEENINIEILNYDTNSKLALNDISG
ncbi:MAG: hypothetical protein U9R19_13120, partial [Bacteroidota bacterium]|nr:hypothetical protein [Bacteroidota bacterium]